MHAQAIHAQSALRCPGPADQTLCRPQRRPQLPSFLCSKFALFLSHESVRCGVGHSGHAQGCWPASLPRRHLGVLDMNLAILFSDPGSWPKFINADSHSEAPSKWSKVAMDSRVDVMWDCAQLNIAIPYCMYNRVRPGRSLTTPLPISKAKYQMTAAFSSVDSSSLSATYYHGPTPVNSQRPA